MATISMIKNSGAVPQPVFLSDAAVEKAYSRAMGGVQLRSGALQGLISAGTKAGQQLAGAGMKYAAELERNEDEVAIAEYKKDLSEKLFDYREEFLSGVRKTANADGSFSEEAVELDSEEKLAEWCARVKEELSAWHEEEIRKENVREGAKRVGVKLKAAMTEDAERFIRNSFEQKYRENRIRERDGALADLESQEAFATAETFSAAKARALAKGATAEQVQAATIKGASMKIQSLIDVQAASLRQWGEQEFLLGRADALVATIEKCIVENADMNFDGKVDTDEKAATEKLKNYAANVFSAGTEAEQKARREARVYEFFSREREALKKAIREKNRWNAAETEKFVGARIAELDTTEEGLKFVAAYFDGDVATAKKTMRERWAESKKQLENAWQADYEKELKARNETQCAAIADALDMFLSGDAEAAQVLARAGICKKDGSAFALTVLPDDTTILPGGLSDPGGRRASSSELLRVVEACRNAYSGQSPEELAYVATQLFGSELSFTNADVRLISKVLNGAKHATPEQREYADKIYVKLAQETSAVATGKKKAAAHGASSGAVFDRSVKEAYFKELEKFYDFCTEFNSGIDQKGSSFRAEIEKRLPEIEGAIVAGKAWDTRLRLLSEMNLALGLLPGRTKTVKYEKGKEE